MTHPTIHHIANSTLEAMVGTLSALLLPGHEATATVRIQIPVVQVAPAGERWQVVWLTQEGSSCRGSFTTKARATRMARAEATRLGGTLAVHRVDGSLQKTYHYGSQAVEPTERTPDTSTMAGASA